MSVNSSIIPKPLFKTCDETSLSLSWDQKALNDAFPKGLECYEIRLQYKEIHESWDHAKEYSVSGANRDGSNGEVLLKQADLVDLKPGTPYFVRLLVINKVEQSRTFGPETVFDTKPIDCTPKKKSCIIS